MLERIQKLENQKNAISGVLLIILGFCMFCMSKLFSGTNFKDFISGVLLGLSIGEILVGMYVTLKSIYK